MKKSIEQIRNELGYPYSDIMKGYFFSTSKDRPYPYHFYWSLKSHVNFLAETLNRYKTVFGWRRLQTDWRPVVDLVIYDRFGSKLTWTEDPKRSVEIKRSDAGWEHWDVLQNRTRTDEERMEELERLYRLFPAKEEL